MVTCASGKVECIFWQEGMPAGMVIGKFHEESGFYYILKLLGLRIGDTLVEARTIIQEDGTIKLQGVAKMGDQIVTTLEIGHEDLQRLCDKAAWSTPQDFFQEFRDLTGINGESLGLFFSWVSVTFDYYIDGPPRLCARLKLQDGKPKYKSLSFLIPIVDEEGRLEERYLKVAVSRTDEDKTWQVDYDNSFFCTKIKFKGEGVVYLEEEEFVDFTDYKIFDDLHEAACQRNFETVDAIYHVIKDYVVLTGKRLTKLSGRSGGKWMEISVYEVSDGRCRFEIENRSAHSDDKFYGYRGETSDHLLSLIKLFKESKSEKILASIFDFCEEAWKKLRQFDIERHEGWYKELLESVP